MPRLDYADRLFDGKAQTNEIPQQWLGTIVKRAYAFLGLNRKTQPAQYTDKTEIAIADRYMAILTQLGFIITITECEYGVNFWRNTWITPRNGTYSKPNCSLWRMVGTNHKCVYIQSPDENLYAQPFRHRYYVTKKDGYSVGYMQNPYIIDMPTFEAKLRNEGYQHAFLGVKSPIGKLLPYNLTMIDRHVNEITTNEFLPHEYPTV